MTEERPKRVERMPTCPYEKHCGNKAEFEEPRDCGSCINTEFRCLACGARGVISEKK